MLQLRRLVFGTEFTFGVLCVAVLAAALLLSHSSPSFLARNLPTPSNGVLSGHLIWLYEDLAVKGPVLSPKGACKERVPVVVSELGAGEITCFSFKYQVTNFRTHALLLKAERKTKSRRHKLMIYNHGHAGLPGDQEHYARHFLTESLRSGIDILLVSMPFTGIDSARGPLRFKTWDGWTTLEPALVNQNPAALHGVFEALDTGASHYMRLFIDNAVLSALFLRNIYDEFHYIGLSGGATVGLYTCSLLTQILDSCFLIAGVMPLTHRLTPNNFGDAEQISSGFHKRQKTLDLIKEIHDSPTSLFLFFNSHDPCCFDGKSARRLRRDLKKLGMADIISIRTSNAHDYDSSLLLSTISNWRSRRMVR